MNFDQESFQNKKEWLHLWFEVDKSENEKLKKFIIYYLIGRCIKTFVWTHNNTLTFVKINNEIYVPLCFLDHVKKYK
jgi:hypothetical protein